jgi:hypothetical protein
MMNSERNGRLQIEVLPRHVFGDCRKPRESSVMVADVSVEIQTEPLSNMSEDR